ncbi:MAG: hypothetical protein J0L76_06560 [Rhodobacterales bacterium]|nr:hypothetical protein [Rhodobacterales bacterium]
MLRILIGSGLLLMTVGFGAAGWQYWKTMPKAAPSDQVAEGAAVAAPAPMRQSWLISPTGGLIPQADVRAYLEQGKFVPQRTLRVVRQARLADLLAEGEKLPEPAFLQALADIRAPRVADGLCPLLLDAMAQECAVNAARVVEGSVDPAAGTASFALDIVYRLKDSGGELPDLAAHVLRSDRMRLDLAPGSEGTASPEAALQTLLVAVDTACSAEGVGHACRPVRLDLDWVPGQPVRAGASIAWLDPLPKGMFVAPPLDPAKGG